MKITVPKPVEIEAKAIRCELAVRYGEEDMPNDFPLRHGEIWEGVIDLDTGRIRDWPKGRRAHMYMKVCDNGTYTLLRPDNTEIAKLENWYVPGCIPGRWGDYVEFDIDETGQVARWAEVCTPENVSVSFFACE